MKQCGDFAGRFGDVMLIRWEFAVRDGAEMERFGACLKQFQPFQQFQLFKYSYSPRLDW
jgi:hypothetical protein